MALTIDNSAKTPDKRQGTGFTNINKLMQANQNNRLGETIAGGVGTQVGQANNALGQSQAKFNNQIGQQRIDLGQNQQKVKNTLSDVAGANDQDVATFQNVLSGQYSGPQGLENADVIKARTQAAQQLGQLGGSQGGKVELLKRFAGGPQYTSGQSKLDSLLLGAGNNVGALNDIRRQSSMLGQKVNTGIDAAQAQGSELKNQIGQFARDTLSDLRNQYTGTTSDIDAKMAQLQSQRAAELAAAQEQLKSGVVDQALLDKLGLKAGMQTYGADFSDLIEQNPLQATRYNVADAAQSAKLAALGRLAGSKFDPSEVQDLSKFANNSQAGTFAASPAIQLDDYGRAVAQNRADAIRDNFTNNITGFAQAMERETAIQRDLNGKGGREANPAAWDASVARQNEARNNYNNLYDQYIKAQGIRLTAKSPDDLTKGTPAQLGNL